MPTPKKPLMSIDHSSVSRLGEAFRLMPSSQFYNAQKNVNESLQAYKDVMVKRSTVGPLYKRTGRLGRSWDLKVRGNSLATLEANIGSFASYSIHHEKGATLTAKLNQWIWIPLPDNLKPNRTAKVSPEEARKKIAAGEWRYTSLARGSVDVLTFGKKNLVIEKITLKQMYLLVKSIKIPPRLGFFNIGEIFLDRTVERLEDFAIEYWKNVELGTSGGAGATL